VPIFLYIHRFLFGALFLNGVRVTSHLTATPNRFHALVVLLISPSLARAAKKPLSLAVCFVRDVFLSCRIILALRLGTARLVAVFKHVVVCYRLVKRIHIFVFHGMSRTANYYTTDQS